MTTQELEKLEQKIKDAESEKSRAEGAKEQLEARLKEEFGCDSVAEANAKLEELEQKIRSRKEKYEELMEELTKALP